MSTEEYDDEWTPITKEECTTLFEHEVALLCPDALKNKFQKQDRGGEVRGVQAQGE